MSRRAQAAAVAAVPAALVAHLLDTSGRLPFVHESEAVRTGMGPLAVVVWLGLTALVVGLAAATRPIAVGIPATLLSAGLPELLARHDPGAALEPGAWLGALIQWLLLLTVVALALVLERVLRLGLIPRAELLLVRRPLVLTTRAVRSLQRRERFRPRAPPSVSTSGF